MSWHLKFRAETPARLAQVLLWLTVVIFSCATLSAKAEDTGYLLRETVRFRLQLPRSTCNQQSAAAIVLPALPLPIRSTWARNGAGNRRDLGHCSVQPYSKGLGPSDLPAMRYHRQFCCRSISSKPWAQTTALSPFKASFQTSLLPT